VHATGDESTGTNIYTYIYIYALFVFSFVFGATAPQWARASSFLMFLDHTQRRTTVGRAPGRVISSSQRPLPDKTRHTQETDVHAPGGIRTYNLSKRVAVDLRLRPHGHWDRWSAVKFALAVSLINCHTSYEYDCILSAHCYIPIDNKRLNYYCLSNDSCETNSYIAHWSVSVHNSQVCLD